MHGYAVAVVSLEAAAAVEADPQEKARLTALADVQRSNRDVYRIKRDELYELAAYEISSERLAPRLDGSWTLLVGGAVVAVVATAAFSFATGPLAIDGHSGDAGGSPTSGLLQPSPEGQHVWAKLHLDRCEIAGSAPVIVWSTTDSDYDVETLETPEGCRGLRFTVPRSLVRLVTVQPTKATIGVEH